MSRSEIAAAILKRRRHTINRGLPRFVRHHIGILLIKLLAEVSKVATTDQRGDYEKMKATVEGENRIYSLIP